MSIACAALKNSTYPQPTPIFLFSLQPHINSRKCLEISDQLKTAVYHLKSHILKRRQREILPDNLITPHHRKLLAILRNVKLFKGASLALFSLYSNYRFPVAGRAVFPAPSPSAFLTYSLKYETICRVILYKYGHRSRRVFVKRKL